MNRRLRAFESKHLLWGLCLAVLAAQAVATVANDWSLLREIRLVFRISPEPFYPFLPVHSEPGRSPSLGADFSQVYYAAAAIRQGDAPYAPSHPEFRDRFGRRPNYPPFTNHLYVPLTWLPYPDALVLHTAAGFVILLGLGFLLLARFGLWWHAAGAAAATLLLALKTPIGFSHLERGQFDLFVASAFLLVLGSVYLGRGAAACTVVGALLGALKWTSAPVLLAFTLAAMVASSSARRRLLPALIPVILGLTAVAFASELADYWPSLRQYELDGPPVGPSLEHLLPAPLAKALPVASTVLFVAWLWLRTRRVWDRERAWQASAVPFALAVALQSQCMLKMVFEYRAVALLGFLPLVVLWMERASFVPRGLRIAVGILVGSFLVVAFRVFDLRAEILSSPHMLYVYLGWSLMFLALGGYVLWHRPVGAEPVVAPP